MKRILIAALAFSLLGGGAASAQDWRRDNGHAGHNNAGRSHSEGRNHDGRGRGDGGQSYRGQGERNQIGRGQMDRNQANRGRTDGAAGRGYGRRGDDRGYDNRADPNQANQNRRYDNRSYGAPRAWARGQRLPPTYMGNGVDYSRYHLRRPPRGYQWVRVDNDYVLAAVGTGLIMEVITGGY